MADPAWNLPFDRAWEKAPPYDRAWKMNRHCHLDSIRLLLEFDFCHSKKKNLSGPVGRPDLKLFARVIRAKHAG